MTESIIQPDADDATVLAQVVDYYHRVLKDKTVAQDYLRKRGIAGSEVIDRFRIGYCDRSLLGNIPRSKDQTGKIIRQRLIRLGLVRASTGHEQFIHFLVFPIAAADGSGRIVDIYGRRIFDNSHTHVPNHKHLAAERTGVWNLEAFVAGEDLIVCPSPFDALSFWTHGFRNVACTFGAVVPSELLQVFQRLPIRRALTPCRKVGLSLLEAGLDCWLLPLPNSVDANAHACQSSDPAQALGALIEKAEKMDRSMGPEKGPEKSGDGRSETGETAESEDGRSEPEKAKLEPTAADELATPKPAKVSAKAKRPNDEESTATAVASGPFSVEADDQKLLAQVVDYYHRTLKGSQEALDYLRQRGITTGQAIDQFRIGYADRTLGLTLPSNKAGRDLRDRLTKLGLFRATSGHEHFNGCVVFPVTSADGTQQIVDLYGRKTLGSKLNKYCQLDLNLPGERKGVWNVEAFGASEEIILCPSLFDALTFWNHGYRNVTCTFGPDALTEDHLSAFKEFNIRRVLTPSEEVTAKLLAAGLDCFLLKFPSGMSANAYALQASDPAQALGAVLRKAEWVGNGQPTSTPTVPLVVEEPQELPQPQSDTPTKERPAAAELEDDALEDLADEVLSDEEAERAEDAESEDAEGADEPDSPLEMETVSAPPVRTDSPLPVAPQDTPADVKADEVVMTLGNRRYRIRGWTKNLSFDSMRVNVMASSEQGMFVDTFDLYSAKHRRTFTVQAATELAVEENTIKKDLGRVMLKLEELQDKQIEATLAPKDTEPVMSPEEKEEATRLLQDPALLDRIVSDFDVVGEQTNKLVGYLAAVSRKLDQPLAIIIQSSSAAGKTALMEAVLAFVPPEDQVKFSAMTGQSLFYMGESNLKHKILAIVEEEGAQRASYALKLLQSEGELRIASTGKDANSGRLITQEYRVEGPMMLFLTTTAIKIDEELLNRCLVLTVDEDREQTRAIHQVQRRRQTLPGLLSSQDRQRTLALHRNAQRLLRPLLVANPYAESLTFLDDKTRTRRDHMKYLTLIRTITLLHQHQRPVRTIEHHDRKVEYIEVTLEDIAMANKLASEVLGRSIDDLPPQTRRLLHLIDELVTRACREQSLDRADYRFSRRDVRAQTGWGHTQLKIHLKRLEELEYLLVHRGGRGQSFVYELLYDAPAEEGQPFLARLIDVDKLRRQRAGLNGELAGATG